MNKNDLFCDICGKQFKYNSIYLKHINKKKPCKNVNLQTIDNEYVDDDNINEIKKIYVNIIQKINDKTKKSIIDKCYFCNNLYSSKSNLLNHIRNNCKLYKELFSQQNKYKELINRYKSNNKITILNEEIIRLKQKNNKNIIKDNNDNNVKTINNNININNNNNNLHIHLNSFGKEDLSHITDEDYKIYIKTIYNGLVSFIKHVHCSEDNPANFNIYLDNPHSKSIKIFQDNKWLLKDSDEVITKIKDDKLNILDKKVEEFNDDKLKTKLEDYKTRLQDNQGANKLLTNRIKDLLYNNNNNDIKDLE